MDRLPPSVVLVLDGAYAEFVTAQNFDSGLALARSAQNVVVTHTFSKIHGLAGLRVGWAYCPSPIANALERIRPPFNTSIPAQAAAIAALEADDFQRQSVGLVERWRPWLTEQLNGLGLRVTSSATNFVLVHFSRQSGRTASEAEAFLATHGILVRNVANYGLPNAVRIAVGLEDHNRMLVKSLADFLME
jgi:histidinol-phosphate aminotransferase